MLSENIPDIISSDLSSEIDILESVVSDPEAPEEDNSDNDVYIMDNPDGLTNDVFNEGIDKLAGVIDPYSVSDEVIYRDVPSLFSAGNDLPDYAVVFEVNGYEVIFPTTYSDDILVVDGMLINLGSNYTAGVQMDGYSVNNYLSSEITIPTYHSATWYQYLQTYGQPYRIVDRYVSNYGSISSSTRDRVSVEWSGGNAWAGFTFDRIMLFLIFLLIAVFFIFRKGR